MKKYILFLCSFFSIAGASELGITKQDCNRLIAEQKRCVVDLFNRQKISVDEAITICGQIQAKKLCEEKGIKFGRCIALYSMDMAKNCTEDIVKAKAELKKKLYNR